MNDRIQWLINLGTDSTSMAVDGLVPVSGYKRNNRPPEEVVMMEKAKAYGAGAVFFEAGRNGRPPVAQAFVFVSDSPVDNLEFAKLHQRLWSWGGVPLIYLKTPGLVRLFRCGHRPDFISSKGELVCKPIKRLKIATAIASTDNHDAWWDASRLRNGTLWDDPAVSKTMLSASKAAHKHLFDAVQELNNTLNAKKVLPPRLRQRLLILSLLIAYLEERGVFLPAYFQQFLKGATRFFQVLADGKALVALLKNLEERFNGHVFILSDEERATLENSGQLAHFAQLVEAHQEPNGQLTLWELYSFKDLPVELISHIYQIFVKNTASSIYTPPFLVRLMLEEALSWQRLDRLHEQGEIVLDPCCGSGVFIVEAYKRLVLHWRSRHEWKRPGIKVLQALLEKVHGVDIEEGAVELAAFSLCLALCDALEPEEIRASIRLFPPLAGKTLHHSCFFEAKEKGLVQERIGVIVGNPPFTSKLTTEGAKRSYQRYSNEHGQKEHGKKKSASVPDKQLAYLFLHEAMEMVTPDGVLSMLQQYNFLYNQQSLTFRRNFMTRWNVREILDFTSVRGLFSKAGADTKVIVVVAEAAAPSAESEILHATFRRSGRADAEQGFDIDYYDMHWLPRQLVMKSDEVWHANLIGGGRVLNFIERLKQYRTLEQYAGEQSWECGEGFIFGNANDPRPASHVIGKAFIPVSGLKEHGIDPSAIGTVPDRPIQWPRREELYTPPFLIIHKNTDLCQALWKENYLTYSHEFLGISAAKSGAENLERVSAWLREESRPLQAFLEGASSTVIASKSTAILSGDILSLPYPETGTLDISKNEQIIIDDILGYYHDFIRRGEDSAAMKESGNSALPGFNTVFTSQINAIYKIKPLQALEAQIWPGVICQPFVFGEGKVDWAGADELQDKINNLLHEQSGTSLNITRIARIYDGDFVFLLKPDRLRYWLRSIALRDADETLADLWAEGF